MKKKSLKIIIAYILFDYDCKITIDHIDLRPHMVHYTVARVSNPTW